MAIRALNDSQKRPQFLGKNTQMRPLPDFQITAQLVLNKAPSQKEDEHYRDRYLNEEKGEAEGHRIRLKALEAGATMQRCIRIFEEMKQSQDWKRAQHEEMRTPYDIALEEGSPQKAYSPVKVINSEQKRSEERRRSLAVVIPRREPEGSLVTAESETATHGTDGRSKSAVRPRKPIRVVSPVRKGKNDDPFRFEKQSDPSPSIDFLQAMTRKWVELLSSMEAFALRSNTSLPAELMRRARTLESDTNMFISTTRNSM
eukprot:TRINITY_DN8271_c0_g1_i1.p1 TRINITY_DN8271_c0_g1~~TRINITY_DN8271_c0_g1_i1.p1  ORF type:complete len:258 (+),score=26.84 TRINITY_DN8271_c0_g1_i1:137-910(+)